MKKKNDLLKNVFFIMVANGISLLGSLSCGFFLPKLMSLNDYGHYKLFTLYLSYTGILHFGLPDGMLLNNAGIIYQDFDKEKMRGISSFYMILEGIIGGVIILGAFFVDAEIAPIVFFLGLCTFSINVIVYFQFVSQACMHFKEFSYVKVVTALLTFIAVSILYAISKLGAKVKYESFLVCYTIINWGVLIFYLIKYKDFVCGKRKKNIGIKQEIIMYVSMGIIITLSYQILQFILNLDKQFIAILYNTSTYAVYSFAYSLLSMITTVVSAISLVLFPVLKKLEKDTAIDFFENGEAGVIALVSISMGVYFFLVKFVDFFLPQYHYSLVFLRILFPGLLFSSCITIIIFTYYKLLNCNSQFLAIGCGILLISAMFNYVAWKAFNLPRAISAASLITIIIWYFLLIGYLKIKFGIRYGRRWVGMLSIGICFYLLTQDSLHLIRGFCVYELLCIVIIFIFYRKSIMALIKKVY